MNSKDELRAFFKIRKKFNPEDKFSNYGRLIAFVGGISTLIALLFIAPYRSLYHNYVLFFVGFFELFVFLFSFKFNLIKKYIYHLSFLIYCAYIVLFTLEVYFRGFIINELLGYIIGVIIISSLIRNFRHLLIYSGIIIFAISFITFHFPDDYPIPLGMIILLLVVVIPTNYVILKSKLNEDNYFKKVIKAINQNSENYKLLLNSTTDSIFIFNANGKLLDLNLLAKDLLKEYDLKNKALHLYLNEFLGEEDIIKASKTLEISDSSFTFSYSLKLSKDKKFKILTLHDNETNKGNFQAGMYQNILFNISLGVIVFSEEGKVFTNGNIEDWLGESGRYIQTLGDFLPLIGSKEQDWLNNIINNAEYNEKYYRKIEMEYANQIWELGVEVKCIAHLNERAFQLSIDRKSIQRIKLKQSQINNEKMIAISNENLLQQNRFLEAILDSNADILIWTMNEAFQITSFNNTFKKHLWNYFDIEAYEGINFKEIFTPFVRNNNFQNLVDPFFKAFKGGRESFIDRLDDKNGEEFWIEMNVSRLKDLENHPGELAIVGQIINDRVEQQLRIKNSLQEKEVLFRELHHRVKNNLQIISSVLKLQKHYLHDEKAKDLMDNLVNRVNSMAIIHENLYYVNDHGFVDFKDYVENLCRHLNITIEGNNIEILTDIAESKLSIDIAIPCGLIINELVTNSIKYAFNEGKGTIFVEMSMVGDDIKLRVKDNGKGLPFNDIEETNGLGLSLVSSLIEQIDGELELNNNEGSEFVIKFTKE